MPILKTYCHHSLLPDAGKLQENKYNVSTDRGWLIFKNNYNILMNCISSNLGNRYGKEFEVSMTVRVWTWLTITYLLKQL